MSKSEGGGLNCHLFLSLPFCSGGLVLRNAPVSAPTEGRPLAIISFVISLASYISLWDERLVTWIYLYLSKVDENNTLLWHRHQQKFRNFQELRNVLDVVHALPSFAYTAPHALPGTSCILGDIMKSRVHHRNRMYNYRSQESRTKIVPRERVYISIMYSFRSQEHLNIREVTEILSPNFNHALKKHREFHFKVQFILYIRARTPVDFAFKFAPPQVLSTPTQTKTMKMNLAAYQLSPFTQRINYMRWFQLPFLPSCTCNFGSGIYPLFTHF